MTCAAPSSRDLGERFERLIRAYLTTDPLFAARFSEVWLWQDWPGRAGVADTGIDLVATEREGGVYAIPCKFYDPRTRCRRATSTPPSRPRFVARGHGGPWGRRGR